MENIEFIELDDASFHEKMTSHTACLVDFYASWCGSCRLAAPMFLNVAKAYGIQIFKVDAEKNPQVRQTTKINSLPTLALYKNGVSVGSLSATKREAVEDFLNQHGFKPVGGG